MLGKNFSDAMSAFSNLNLTLVKSMLVAGARNIDRLEGFSDCISALLVLNGGIIPLSLSSSA